MIFFTKSLAEREIVKITVSGVSFLVDKIIMRFEFPIQEQVWDCVIFHPFSQ